MLLVGVLWVLPMLALALLFSEGDGLVETGCRFAPEQGHPEERREERPMRTWRKGKEHLTERERDEEEPLPGRLAAVELISSPVGYPERSRIRLFQIQIKDELSFTLKQ